MPKQLDETILPTVSIVGDREMLAGQCLGSRYRLEGRLEDGGMGSVWRAWDTRLLREVAVKILHRELAQDKICRDRFRTEARAVASMRHSGIVGVFDYGEEHDNDGNLIAYLVMELVKGRQLAHVLQDTGRMAAGPVTGIIAAAAAALDSAHRIGVIHRDIKPSNILIDAATGSPKIIDFGIARAGAGMGLTSAGMVMGTASYVSPEQLRGGSPSASSDVYSLGVVAYECLAGRRPFHDEDTWRVIEGHLNDIPPPLPDDVPSPVARTVMRALAKDPAVRWHSAREFALACRGMTERPGNDNDPDVSVEHPQTGSGRWRPRLVGQRRYHSPPKFQRPSSSSLLK